MRRPLIIFALASACACGSVYLSEPYPIPDFQECRTVRKSLTGHAIDTPIPVPFSGPRTITLFTDRPDGWDAFDGTIHLRGLSWDIDWISNGSIQIDGLTVAVLRGGEWSTSPTVDLRPAISTPTDSSIAFTAKLKGSGVKPAGKPSITVEARIAICGEGRDRVADSLYALENWRAE